MKFNPRNGEPSQRQRRVSEEIRFILAGFFQKDIVQEETLESRALTITHVSISPDLKQARVFVVSRDEADLDESIRMLNQKTAIFRNELAQALTMKYVPRLFFKADLTYAKANRIEELLRSPHVAQDLKKKTDDDTSL